MRTQLSLPVQFGGLGIGDNVVIADASNIGAAALVVGQAVTFLRAQHATLSDAGAFFSDPSGVSNPHSLYLVGASSIHQALATPTLELDAGASASAPMWAVEPRAAHTRVVDECGDAVLGDLAGPLASALKLHPSKRSHVARAGCSAAGAEPASAMRSAADLQAIPHYSDFPLHSMRKVQETLSHRIHTVRFAKLALRMPTSGPDSNRFRGRLLRAATSFLVTDPPSMLARFEDASVEFTPSTWAVAYADHVARCYGSDSNHATHEWAAHGLSDICHDVMKSALGVGVQILTDPSVLVSLPKGSDGRPADVGLFGYGGIRGNTVAVDTTIAPILGMSRPDPTTALRAAERHKIQNLSTRALSLGNVQLDVPSPGLDLNFGEIWQLYNQQLEQRPLLTKAVVMALGLALGDVLATVVTGATACLAKTAHMAAFGLLFQGPALHLLHSALDARVMPNQPTSALAVACKTAIDQLAFAPISTAVFFITMELCQGNIAGITSTLTSKLAPTMLASYTIWPLALLFNYAKVPPKQRILFINAVTVLWAVVLSMLSSGAI
eukprot:jgi/Tetstr1/438779/TSEL_027288.t1